MYLSQLWTRFSVQDKQEIALVPSENRNSVLIRRDLVALPASLISQIGYRCHPKLYTEGDPGEKLELVAGRHAQITSCSLIICWENRPSFSCLHLVSFRFVAQLVPLIKSHGNANNKTRTFWSLSSVKLSLIVKVEGKPELTEPLDWGVGGSRGSAAYNRGLMIQ